MKLDTAKERQLQIEIRKDNIQEVPMSSIPTKMTGAILPGNSTLELKQFDVPKPGHGEVLLRT